MALKKATFIHKAPGDELFSTGVETLRDAINANADVLAQALVDLLNKVDAAGVATVLSAAGKPLNALVLPMMVRMGLWYTDGLGIWEARQTFSASVAPAAGANWRQIASFTGTFSPAAAAVTAASITDATAAGRALMTAADAATQLALVDKLSITANEYGTHPAFSSAYGKPAGADNIFEFILKTVLAVAQAQAPEAPDAPTLGQVDDTGHTFSGQVVTGFTTLGEYEGQQPGGAYVPLTTLNGYLQGNRVYYTITGPAGIGAVALRIAASGSRPAGGTLTNATAFTMGTGTVTPAPTATTPDAPFPSFDPATRTLTYAHALGSSELEINHLGGSYQPYAPVSVDDASHGAGEWKARVKAYVAGNRNASGSADSPAIAPKVVANQAVAPIFGPIDDTNNVVTLNSQYAYTELRWGLEGQATQALGSNSICSPGNVAGRLFAYVVADAGSTRLQSETRYSDAFSLAAANNNPPTASLSSPQANTTIAVGQPVVLNATPQDSDGTIQKVEFLDNGVKFAETTVAPHTIQTNITAGGHSYTARPIDDKGAPGLSNAVTVTGQLASSGQSTLIVTAANQRHNKRAVSENGGTRYDSNTVLEFMTDASSLTVNMYGYNKAGYALLVGNVWVGSQEAPYTSTYTDGSTIATIGTFADQKVGSQAYTLNNLPGTGMRKVTIYAPGQQNQASQNPCINYVSLVSVEVPTGYTVTAVPVPTASELIFLFGDSTTQAGGHGDTSFSWPRIFARDYRPNSDVIVAGHSAMVGGRFISTATGITALLDEYATARAGYESGKMLFDSMVNDVYFNAYTPAQLGGFYRALAAEFIRRFPTDALYFKSAITRTTTPEGEGNNGLGYPLLAYRDAMAQAVADVADVRVKYIDGRTVARASDLMLDGTHQTKAGDIYTAGKMNEFFNANAGSADLHTLNVEQFGSVMRLSTDSIQPVQYRMGGTGNFLDVTSFSTPAMGNVLFEARLKNNTATVVSRAVAVNHVVYFNSPELHLVGSGWQASSGNPRVGYTTKRGDSYYVNGKWTQYFVYNTRQPNTPQLSLSLDGDTATVVQVAGPEASTTVERVYASGVVPLVDHVLSVTAGTGDSLNFQYLECVGFVAPTKDTPPTPPAPPNILKNGEFTAAPSNAAANGWFASVYDNGTNTFVAGGDASIDTAAGVAVLNGNSSFLTQESQLTAGQRYLLELKVLNVAAGRLLQIGSDTPGTGQINSFTLGNGTAVSQGDGVYYVAFTATQALNRHYLYLDGPGTANVEYTRLNLA